MSFAPSEKRDCEISWLMILARYFSTKFAESFIGLTGIPSSPIILLALSGLTFSFISSLEAGTKSKLKEYDKRFYFMIIRLGWLL